MLSRFTSKLPKLGWAAPESKLEKQLDESSETIILEIADKLFAFYSADEVGAASPDESAIHILKTLHSLAAEYPIQIGNHGLPILLKVLKVEIQVYHRLSALGDEISDPPVRLDDVCRQFESCLKKIEVILSTIRLIFVTNEAKLKVRAKKINREKEAAIGYMLIFIKDFNNLPLVLQILSQSSSDQMYNTLLRVSKRENHPFQSFIDKYTDFENVKRDPIFSLFKQHIDVKLLSIKLLKSLFKHCFTSLVAGIFSCLNKQHPQNGHLTNAPFINASSKEPFESPAATHMFLLDALKINHLDYLLANYEKRLTLKQARPNMSTFSQFSLNPQYQYLHAIDHGIKKIKLDALFMLSKISAQNFSFSCILISQDVFKTAFAHYLGPVLNADQGSAYFFVQLLLSHPTPDIKCLRLEKELSRAQTTLNYMAHYLNFFCSLATLNETSSILILSRIPKMITTLFLCHSFAVKSNDVSQIPRANSLRIVFLTFLLNLLEILFARENHRDYFANLHANKRFLPLFDLLVLERQIISHYLNKLALETNIADSFTETSKLNLDTEFSFQISFLKKRAFTCFDNHGYVNSSYSLSPKELTENLAYLNQRLNLLLVKLFYLNDYLRNRTINLFQSSTSIEEIMELTYSTKTPQSQSSLGKWCHLLPKIKKILVQHAESLPKNSGGISYLKEQIAASTQISLQKILRPEIMNKNINFLYHAFIANSDSYFFREVSLNNADIKILLQEYLEQDETTLKKTPSPFTLFNGDESWKTDPKSYLLQAFHPEEKQRTVVDFLRVETLLCFIMTLRNHRGSEEEFSNCKQSIKDQISSLAQFLSLVLVHPQMLDDVGPIVLFAKIIYVFKQAIDAHPPLLMSFLGLFPSKKRCFEIISECIQKFEADKEFESMKESLVVGLVTLYFTLMHACFRQHYQKHAEISCSLVEAHGLTLEPNQNQAPPKPAGWLLELAEGPSTMAYYLIIASFLKAVPKQLNSPKIAQRIENFDAIYVYAGHFYIDYLKTLGEKVLYLSLEPKIRVLICRPDYLKLFAPAQTQSKENALKMNLEAAVANIIAKEKEIVFAKNKLSSLQCEAQSQKEDIARAKEATESQGHGHASGDLIESVRGLTLERDYLKYKVNETKIAQANIQAHLKTKISLLRQEIDSSLVELGALSVKKKGVAGL